MAVTDLSSGGFGRPWAHRRSYSNQLLEDQDFGNGYNWLVKAWPYVVEEDADTVVVVFDSRQAFWFDKVGDSFVARFGAKQTLTHDEVNHLFKLTFPDGHVWQFHDLDQGTYPEGIFKQVTTPGGQTTEATSYTGGRIGEVQRSHTAEGTTTTESYLYTYLASGENAGRLEYVTLRRRVDEGAWSNIRRVHYTYYGSGEDHGSLGDLKTATRQHPSGESWVDGDVYYYRYYKDGEQNGFAHGLKYALEPQAYKKLADDPEVDDPFTAADTKVAEYACYYFQYDADRRVSKERVFGASREYTFTYTDGTHADGYNQWKRKTTETRPDGSQHIVYTNHIGQVLLRELKTQSADEHWIEYWKYDEDGRLILHANPSAISGYVDNAGGL